jgi:putative endonuclease
MASHLDLGRAGEDAAAALLQGMGFRILDRNWRCSFGELDIVAARGTTVVFCEVKARAAREWGEPAEAVDRRKQARLRRLAGRWLAEHKAPFSRVRFDVVSVVAPGGPPEVTHIPEAF